MRQHTDEQLASTKRAEAALNAHDDGMAEVDRAGFGDEESDTQGYRWREEKPERPPFVDPWDGKPWPWGLGVPPVTNP